jgi:alpha,alpha-trehalase
MRLVINELRRLATGGFVPGSVERLSDAELNVTKTIGNVDGNVCRPPPSLNLLMTRTHQMFEKFSNLDINAAGRGGEYTVQVNSTIQRLCSMRC